MHLSHRVRQHYFLSDAIDSKQQSGCFINSTDVSEHVHVAVECRRRQRLIVEAVVRENGREMRN